MDKYRNVNINQGASKIFLMARNHGLSCRRLTWNPNYKEFDDWQLALRRKQIEEKEVHKLTFKEQYLSGLCGLDHIESCTEEWHKLPDDGITLRDYLGLTEREYNVFLQTDLSVTFEQLMNGQRRKQCFRVYQLDFEGGKTVPYAFSCLEKLYKLGMERPRASDYTLVHDGEILCPREQSDEEVLERIFDRFNDSLPAFYRGRSISTSDIIELYGDGDRKYFYREKDTFTPVEFSPMLAKKPYN